MEWKWNKCTSVHEAVDKKSGGRANEYLYGDNRLFLIQNLQLLATWILAYVKQQACFYIVGDYDADGVNATAELYILLKKIGAENVVIRTPKRTEGYGMSAQIVSEFVTPGVIITVDNGISAIEAVAEAKKRGHVVLITDHHLPKMENGQVILPNADLIVDPHVDDAIIQKNGLIETQYREYCGAGLVYKLAQLLIPGTKELEEISAMAAIATIADVVPLTGDNRNIFKRGVQAIQTKKIKPGLQKIVDHLMSNNVVTETDIGFKIAPMLNAPGRIYPDGASLSVNTLLSDNFKTAMDYASQLNQANEERKNMKSEAVSRAEKLMTENCLYGMNPIVIYDPETEEGIIGLVAGSITEKYNATSIVFTRSNTDGVIKGSGRAPEYCNLKKGLDFVHDSHPEFFAGYGGHAKAAGISIYEKYLDEFTDAMQDAMGSALPVSDCIEYDLEVGPGTLTETVEEVLRYAPFGEGNPPVIVRVNHFKLVPKGNSFYDLMGENSIKFYGAGCEAIAFGMAEKYEKLRSPMEIDLVGKLSYHFFKSTKVPQIEVIDFKASERAALPVSNLNVSIGAQLKQFGLAM